MAGFSTTFTVVDEATKKINEINNRIRQMREPFERQAKAFDRLAENTGLKRIAEGLTEIGNSAEASFGSVTKLVPLLTTLSGPAAIAGLVKLTDSFANWSRELTLSAAQAEITTGQFQLMQNAAKLLGGDAVAMSKALIGVETTLHNIATGEAPQAELAYRRAGIAFRDSTTGQRKHAADIFPQIIKYLGTLTHEQDQYAEATRLGARELADLYQDVKAGNMTMEQAIEKARTMGVVSEDNQKSLREYSKAVGALSVAFTNLGGSVAANAAPVIVPFVNFLTRNMGDVLTGLLTVFAAGRIASVVNMGLAFTGLGAAAVVTAPQIITLTAAMAGLWALWKYPWDVAPGAGLLKSLENLAKGKAPWADYFPSDKSRIQEPYGPPMPGTPGGAPSAMTPIVPPGGAAPTGVPGPGISAPSIGGAPGGGAPGGGGGGPGGGGGGPGGGTAAPNAPGAPASPRGPGRPPGSPGGTGGGVGGVGGLPQGAQEAISRAEGTMGANGIDWNVQAGERPGATSKNLESMTLAQVAALPGPDFGGLQINRVHLKDTGNLARLGMDPNTTLFTRDVQQKIGSSVHARQGLTAWNGFRAHPDELQRAQQAINAPAPEAASGGGPAPPGQPPVPGGGGRAETGRAGGVEPELTAAMKAAYQTVLPPGWTARVTSGVREGDPGAHGQGSALDFQVFDPKGNAIPNRGEDTTGYYRKAATEGLARLMVSNPALAETFAWGGHFGTQKGGGGPPDLMHVDAGFRGPRGRYGDPMAERPAAMARAAELRRQMAAPQVAAAPPPAPAQPPTRPGQPAAATTGMGMIANGLRQLFLPATAQAAPATPAAPSGPITPLPTDVVAGGQVWRNGKPLGPAAAPAAPAPPAPAPAMTAPKQTPPKLPAGVPVFPEPPRERGEETDLRKRYDAALARYSQTEGQYGEGYYNSEQGKGRRPKPESFEDYKARFADEVPATPAAPEPAVGKRTRSSQSRGMKLSAAADHPSAGEANIEGAIGSSAGASGSVDVNITHRNPPPGSSVDAKGKGAVKVKNPRVDSVTMGI